MKRDVPKNQEVVLRGNKLRIAEQEEKEKMIAKLLCDNEGWQKFVNSAPRDIRDRIANDEATFHFFYGKNEKYYPQCWGKIYF